MTTSDDFGISADVLDATPSGSHAILGGCSSCVAVTVGASTGVCPSFVFVSACAGLALCWGCTLTCVVSGCGCTPFCFAPLVVDLADLHQMVQIGPLIPPCQPLLPLACLEVTLPHLVSMP